MKQKPEDWKHYDPNRKFDFLVGESTGVCNCTPVFGETCKRCDAHPDIEEKDRNYHEEAIILARGMGRTSRKDDEYWMFMDFLKLEDPETFNFVIREYFVEKGYDFDTAYAVYHKSLRQVDQYTHLRIDREKPDERGDTCVSSGILGSMLHSFLNMSEVPYHVLKKLMSL